MLFSNLLKRVETGVPGVKPPEPVIAVVEHQCLQNKKDAISKTEPFKIQFNSKFEESFAIF